MEEVFCQVSNLGVRVLNGQCNGRDLTSDLDHVVENEVCQHGHCVPTHSTRHITQSVCVCERACGVCEGACVECGASIIWTLLTQVKNLQR